MVHFFDFPREVRNFVYDHYVTIKGGYILDFASDTNRGAGNEPLDLAFIHTCKKAASDLDGLPLALNALTFSTVYLEEHRSTAGRFNLMELLSGLQVLYRPRGFGQSRPNPWAVSSREWLEAAISNSDRWFKSGINSRWSFDRPGYQISKIKHRYSAAAVAIRFLESLSHGARMEIRRIVLNEDWKAVGYAECHGVGLIPYCLENPLLFVDRRVDIWRTVFQTTTIFEFKDPVMPPKDDDPLPAHQISYRAAVWIAEAVELAYAGMPRGCLRVRCS
ncbi:uncharacterized protein BDZ83DRAFT_730579 [Colletotrichum acutatum]|uniref:Uncharacterized protein n=1 Tax=Glomerella acutata TaxID=27357 RepID=A0AAD8UNP4_GLOAC|nr:uncharacterized protein BDZ83DRAFT_730579 [Colletotrichum acutatum]KAK1725149.1 hypothetical protein BDZ83DRAFT_730579 [Colletotrichum acutatum]